MVSPMRGHERLSTRPMRLLAWWASLAITSAVYGDSVTVICPPALQEVLRPWVQLRQEAGHRVTVVDRIATARTSKPTAETEERRVLILVGDGAGSGLPPRHEPAKIIRRYGPEATIATDLPWRDASGADVVARLPFNERDTLAAYLSRVIAREQHRCTPNDTRIQLTAGVGGFSPIIDAAIEGAGQRIVSGLAPRTAEVSLDRVGDKKFTSGKHHQARGGVWVWLGHGQRHALPGVSPRDLVLAAKQGDVAVLLACYAGDFAAPGRCVAEQLLQDADGPLAVIASTRVSMPYGNARLGGELLAAMGRSRNASLGTLWSEALRHSHGAAEEELLATLDPLAQLLGGDAGSLGEERREHSQMYCLLGDPLLVVDRTDALPIEVPSRAYLGDQLVVRCEAPAAGRLRIVVRRHPRTSQKNSSEELAYATNIMSAGEIQLPINLPIDWRVGKRLVRVFFESEEGTSVGAATIRLESPPRPLIRQAARPLSKTK